MLINVKIPTSVGILTLMSRKSILDLTENEKKKNTKFLDILYFKISCLAELSIIFISSVPEFCDTSLEPPRQSNSRERTEIIVELSSELALSYKSVDGNISIPIFSLPTIDPTSH